MGPLFIIFGFSINFKNCAKFWLIVIMCSLDWVGGKTIMKFLLFCTGELVVGMFFFFGFESEDSHIIVL